jgi:hypothetical protein
MMDETQIKSAIEKKRGSTPYAIWTIGITNDPERRKNEHKSEGKNVTHWSHWYADSESIARRVEDHFLNKGMKGGGGGGENPRYVYVF